MRKKSLFLRVEWSLFVNWIPITQDCFVYFPYFVVISPLKRAWPFIWTNLNPFHQRMLCVKVDWNWLIGSWEEDFKILSMYFCYCVNISPLGKAFGPSFKQIESPLGQKKLYSFSATATSLKSSPHQPFLSIVFLDFSYPILIIFSFSFIETISNA